MMLSDVYYKLVTELHTVLILVIVDDALWLSFIFCYGAIAAPVLILVIVDDALW